MPAKLNVLHNHIRWSGDNRGRPIGRVFRSRPIRSAAISSCIHRQINWLYWLVIVSPPLSPIGHFGEYHQLSTAALDGELCSTLNDGCVVVQSQTAVTAYYSSKQLLSFGHADQCVCKWIGIILKITSDVDPDWIPRIVISVHRWNFISLTT